MLQIVRTVL